MPGISKMPKLISKAGISMSRICGARHLDLAVRDEDGFAYTLMTRRVLSWVSGRNSGGLG
eukprot:4335655-Amphidinium_carterae.1